MNNVTTMPRARWLACEWGCDKGAAGERTAGVALGSRSGEASALAAGLTGECRRILVATDFSEASTRAVERAVVLAKKCGAALTLLHVIDVNVGPAGDVMRGLWETARVEMSRLASWLDGRVVARGEVVEGLPAEVIVEKSQGHDLVVLGKKAQRSRWNLFAKHTVDRVARCASCPVMVVGEGAVARVCVRLKR